jgi:hypothetical protein
MPLEGYNNDFFLCSSRARYGRLLNMETMLMKVKDVSYGGIMAPLFISLK